MALARSLTGDVGESAGESCGGGETVPSDLQGMLGQLDPELLSRGLGVLRGLQGEEDRGTALLAALKPFLREERRERMDRAMQVMQMTRLLRLTMGRTEEKGAGDV